LPDVDLRRMASQVPQDPSQPALHHLPEVRDRVLASIERLRVDEAEQLLSRAALSMEPREFLMGVVVPVMTEIGDRWERGELRIVHEHACSTVMRGLLFSLMRLYPASDARRRAVVATPASEDHELGALMVAMLAAMHGWGVLYLGTDLPADEIAYAVANTGADLLMLSVTNLDPEASERELAAIERAVPARVKILAGGQAAKALPESRIEIQQDLAAAERELSR